MSNNYVRMLQSNGPTIEIEGPCLAETIAALEAGVGGNKPMSRAAIEGTRRQIEIFIEMIADNYTKNVAAGEIGRDGSGVATSASPLGGQCPTGLLYGRIQSGKTLAMTLLSAMAFDNGFRVVIILTSDNVKLVEQTAKRLVAVGGPILKDTGAPGKIDEWAFDASHVRQNIGHNGLIVVCSKNNTNLKKLTDFLEEIEAANFPSLILDDEADQATLDTNTARRIRSDDPESVEPSAIHRRTVNDPDEPERALKRHLRHNVFVQVTATPYAQVLLSQNSVLRPAFIHLLEPGEGYCGGERFFTDELIEAEAPPLVFVDESESQLLNSPDGRAPTDGPPIGLKRAICFYVLAAATQQKMDPSKAAAGQNFLCHTSPLKNQHDMVSDLIREYVIGMIDEIRATNSEGVGATQALLRWAYQELLKTVPNAPSLETLLVQAHRFLPRRNVLTVNSDAGSDIPHGFNVLIGGNILGRGLTIDNLLVTYYTRKATKTQMDTTYQHARMFGYRAAILPLTRLFLPEDVASRFRDIHEAELALREFIRENPDSKHIPLQRTSDLRPSRGTVLDGTAIELYAPGKQIYPPKPPDLSLKAAGKEDALLEEKCNRLISGSAHRNGDFYLVSIDDVIDMIRNVSITKDSGRWNSEALTKVLSSIRNQFDNKAYLLQRKMRRGGRNLSTGATSSAERSDALSLDAPVLFMFRDQSEQMRNYAFWYPTLVLPDRMSHVLINLDATRE